ncbi:hypothetical protein PR048_033155 [Dryococelus australis]|uniref:Uncharacterized protein n=1 Tax=Dryococelus australis TaxID=614101 RepID=A0ABQ9FZG1_9NEOP|nr:hypothetical protein PR048_033155 [Dryococelus australis]
MEASETVLLSSSTGDMEVVPKSLTSPNTNHKTQSNVPANADDATTLRPMPENKYLPMSSGSFVVFIEGQDKNVVNLHRIQIGKLLFHMAEEIVEIFQAESNSLKILLKTAGAGNPFVSSSTLSEHKLKAYIPNSLVQKQGLEYGIPLDVSDEDIKVQRVIQCAKVVVLDTLTIYVVVINCVVRDTAKIIPSQIALRQFIVALTVQGHIVLGIEIIVDFNGDLLRCDKGGLDDSHSPKAFGDTPSGADSFTRHLWEAGVKVVQCATIEDDSSPLRQAIYALWQILHDQASVATASQSLPPG